MSKTTTPKQYEKLMQENKDIAQGYQKRPKEEVQLFWEDVACTLNALGPPQKDSNTWKKVWIDWKCYIKKKLATNKREMTSTGGGPCKIQRISPLDEKVIALTGLTTCTSGLSGAMDFGDILEVQYAEGAPMDTSACLRELDKNVPSTSRRSKEKRQENDCTASLLKEQIQLQKEFYADSKNKNEEIVACLKHIHLSMDKMTETLGKHLEEGRRHNQVMEDMLREKMELKMQILEQRFAKEYTECNF